MANLTDPRAGLSRYSYSALSMCRAQQDAQKLLISPGVQSSEAFSAHVIFAPALVYQRSEYWFLCRRCLPTVRGP